LFYPRPLKACLGIEYSFPYSLDLKYFPKVYVAKPSCSVSCYWKMVKLKEMQPSGTSLGHCLGLLKGIVGL
jgi:hypothetical protein